MSGVEVIVEYAIRWAEPVPGLQDVSTPHESRAMVEMALEGSAFAGVIVQRTVTKTAWTEDTTARPAPGTEEALVSEQEREAFRAALQPMVAWMTDRLVPALEKLDAALTKAGEDMAEDAEEWLREVTR